MHLWRRNIEGYQAFYLNGLMRALFMSMTTIYVPIFLFIQGKAMWGSVKAGLLLVVAFFVVQRAVVLLSVFPISRWVEKIGFRKSITWSALFLLIYTISLYFASQNMVWIWVSTVFMGLNIPTYWLARDSALSQDIPGAKMGSRMGYIVAMENVAGLLGPFAGGTIVAMFGYPSLFMIVLFVLILSIIPLWWMSPHSHKNGVSWAGFKYFLKNKRYLHQSVAVFGNAMNDYGNSIVWPLVLFLQGIKNETMGAIYSGAAVVAVAIQYLSGKWFDNLRAKNDYSDEGVYGFATVGLSLSWLARIFTSGVVQVSFVDMGRQIFGSVYGNFFSDYIHLGGKRMGSIAYWVYIEIIYSIGTIFLFGIMAVGIYWGVWKEMVLSTVALWSLATIVIARESNMR